MYNFRHDYKKKPFGFGNVKESRFLRANRNEESRKRQRTSNFNSNRNLPNSFFETQDKEVKSIPLKEDRMTRLLKWKAEREKMKKFEQTKKKPPFVVGLVHHKIYSPLNKDRNNIICNHQSKRVTRITMKKLNNKNVTKEVNSANLNKDSKNITKEAKISRRSQNRNDLSFISRIAKEFPQVPLFGRVPLYSMSPATVMPFITNKTMGSNRKSNKKFSIKNDDTSVTDIKFNVNIPKDSPTKRTLSKLSFDGNKASNLCNNNTNNKNDNTVTKSVRNKTMKLTQNKTNIKTGSSPNFNISGKLRLQAWKEEDLLIDKPIVKKKTAVKKKVVATKSRELIPHLNHVLKNKYKKNESHPVTYTRKSISIERNKNKVTPMKRGKRISLLQKLQLSEKLNKTKSPLTIMKINQGCKIPKIQLDDSISYISSNETPKKSKLKQQRNLPNIEYGVKSRNKVNINDPVALNKVSVNEERKANLDLSVVLSKLDDYEYILKPKLDKNVDIKNKEDMEGYNETTKVLRNRIVTSTDTPIIKKNLPNIEYGVKSTNEVNINGPIALNKVPINEERKTKLDLAVILSKVDGYDYIFKEKLEKNVDTSKTEDMEEHEAAKVLRNRIVTSTDTPITNRKSFRKLTTDLKELEHKENKTPLKRRGTRSILKRNSKNNEKSDIDNFDNNTSSKKNNGKRRSTRSIQFSEKECSIVGKCKETLPMTPYTRNKIYSNNKEWDSIFKEDSASLEMEQKPPKRIRKSQNRKV